MADAQAISRPPVSSKLAVFSGKHDGFIKRGFMFGIAAVALLGITLGSANAKPFIHEFNEWRNYSKHWLGVCPKEKRIGTDQFLDAGCRAVTFTEIGGFFPGNRLTVTRNRETGSMRFYALRDERLINGAPVVFQVDRKPPITVNYQAGIDNARYGVSSVSGNEYEVIDKAKRAQLLGQMKAGNGMTITWNTVEGAKSDYYSLIGLTAALNFAQRYSQRD